MTEFLNSQDIGARKQKGLPASDYLCPSVFQREQARIFSHHWLCVARESEFAESGSFHVIEVGSESVIIVRDQTGSLRAHLNLCRHRGTRICEAANGKFSRSIQCPYHAWTYSLAGELIGVPDEQTIPDFRRADHGLHSVACHCWEGFVWINLALSPPAFETAFAPVLHKFRDWNLERLVSLGQMEYRVRANWKLIVQNYSECYHCSPVHPGLVKLSPPRSGGNDLIEGPFLGGYMDVTLPGGSLTQSGRSCGVAVGPLSSAQQQRVYYYVLFPHVLLSLHHDYVMVHTLWPLEAGITRVNCQWLFNPETLQRSDLDPQDGIRFWDQTNREDWHVSELTQLGVASSRYQPGPYSDREAMTAAFDRHYLRLMQSG
jgi:Rieske 2Fe-2S family protein